MTDEDTPEVGSVSEEAAKLFAALSGWSREQGGSAAGAASSVAGALHDVNDHLANGEDCRYCPVCRGIQVVRQLSPDVREHLVSAAGSLAQAAAAFAESLAQPPRPETNVERIDLD